MFGMFDCKMKKVFISSFLLMLPDIRAANYMRPGHNFLNTPLPMIKIFNKDKNTLYSISISKVSNDVKSLH